MYVLTPLEVFEYLGDTPTKLLTIDDRVITLILRNSEGF